MGQVPTLEKDRNREIFEAFQSGATQRSLAKKYGVSQARIWQIIRRERFYEVVPSMEDEQI